MFHMATAGGLCAARIAVLIPDRHDGTASLAVKTISNEKEREAPWFSN
jgi:hypothetical protein